MALAARAGAIALQQPAAAAAQRFRPRHAAVARAGRRDEASGERRGIDDSLFELIPDPAADENLLEDDQMTSALANLAKADANWDSYGYSGPAASAGNLSSGSDLETWSQAGSSDAWFLSEYDMAIAGGGDGGGRGGGADVGAAMGATVGDPNFAFDQLKSEDWSDQLVSEVGEGNSFRREQRERYGAPVLNMTNLAHASEEELLVGAEAQALRDDKVEKLMSDAMTLHHYFFEKANNRYAIAVRFGELIEQIEYDDWNLPLEGEEQGIPSWVRAKFALNEEYEELNARVKWEDELRSAAEMQFFEDSVARHVQKQLDWEAVLEGRLPQAGDGDDRGKSALEQALEDLLPGAKDPFESTADADTLADDLLSRASQQADAEYLAALEGTLEEEEEEQQRRRLDDDDEEQEEDGEAGEDEDDELALAAAGGQKQRRGPRLSVTHQHKVQAAAEDRERHKAEVLGMQPLSGRPSDPLLDLLERHDQAS